LPSDWTRQECFSFDHRVRLIELRDRCLDLGRSQLARRGTHAPKAFRQKSRAEVPDPDTDDGSVANAYQRPQKTEFVHAQKRNGRSPRVPNWGAHAGKVQGVFPSGGLRYPKGEEKSPFMTHAEVERRIADRGLSEAQASELWDSL
jgi:hypothetical protein